MLSKQKIKIFIFEDFFHLTTVSTTQVVHLELRISPQIFERKKLKWPQRDTQGLGGTDS
jgi:hypothetical protein